MSITVSLQIFAGEMENYLQHLVDRVAHYCYEAYSIQDMWNQILRVESVNLDIYKVCPCTAIAPGSYNSNVQGIMKQSGDSWSSFSDYFGLN